MTDTQEKSLNAPQRLLRIAALVTVLGVCFVYGKKSWEQFGTQALIHMTIIKSHLDYEVGEDGMTTYHFGRSRYHYVSCDGSVPATWEMPGDVEATMLGGICEKIETQRHE